MSNLAAITPKTDPDVIEILEGLLKDAKDGKLIGVVVATKQKDACYYSTAGMRDRYETIGYLHHMIFKLHQE